MKSIKANSKINSNNFCVIRNVSNWRVKFQSTISIGLSILFMFSISCSNPDKSQNQLSAQVKTQIIEMKLPPHEFVKWVEDERNQLYKVKRIDEIEFSAQYQPAQYLACMQNTSANQNTTDINSDVFDDLIYFKITLRKIDGQDELLRYNISSVNEYQNRVNYYAFDFKEDISLEQNGIIIPCEMLHFERSFNATNSCNFMIGFDKKKINDQKCTLIISDRIFNKGIVKFSFPESMLTTLPKLILI